MGERRRQRSLQLLMMLLITIFVTGCASEPNLAGSKPEADFYCHTDSPGYCAGLASSGGQVEAVGQRWLSRPLAGGTAVEAFEVQAYRAQQAGIASAWRPDYLTTVVIMIDRDQTDEVITSWTDLANTSQVVSITRQPVDGWLILSAIEWGLTDQLMPGRAAFKLVGELRRNGHLASSGPATITVGFDHQAADRRAAGENLEVIVPSDGTLSFVKGLVGTSARIPGQPGLAGELASRGYAAPDAKPPAGATLIPGADMPYQGSWMANYRRVGLGENLLHIADHVESTIVPLLAVVGLIGWVGWFVRRGSQPSVRRAAVAIGSLAVVWLVLRLLRYQTQHELASELLWYAYYLPMLGLPMCLLWLAWVVDRPIDTGHPPRWWWLLLGLHLALFGLVMTNSAHHLVFSFFTDAGGGYRYELGYYVVAVAAALSVLVAVSLLLVKSNKVPGRRYPWLPLVVVAVLLGYLVVYNMGIKLFRQTDVTLGIIFFGVLLIESAVRTGTLPLNTDYEKLFEASTLRMRIVDADSGAELTAAGSQTGVRDAVNLVEFSAPIRGGKVVWAEDISAITSLQHHTTIAIDRLQTLNTMLQTRREAEREVVAAGVRAHVLAEMETEVDARVAELDALVAALPPGQVEQRALARIALRASFVKRRAALFFQLQGGESVSTDELGRHFAELAQLAVPAGLNCTVRLPDDHELMLNYPELLYESVFRLIDHAVANRARALVAQVNGAAGYRELRCLLPAAFADFSFDEDLLTKLVAVGAEFGWRTVDESLAMFVQVPVLQGAGGDD